VKRETRLVAFVVWFISCVWLNQCAAAGFKDTELGV